MTETAPSVGSVFKPARAIAYNHTVLSGIGFSLIHKAPRTDPSSLNDWERLLASVAIPGNIVLSTEQHSGTLDVKHVVGGGIMSHLNVSSQEINHCKFNLKPDKNKNLLIHVVTVGAGSIEQNGVKFEFEPGDINYRNAGIPSIVSFEEPTRLIALRLPANRLIDYVNTNEFNHPRQLKSNLVLFHLIHNLTDFFLQNDEEISSFHLPAIEQSLIIMFGCEFST